MSYSELTYKIAFSLIKNLYADSALKILDSVGGMPAYYFEATEADLRKKNLSADISSRKYRDELIALAVKEEQFVTKNGIHCYFITDSNYPLLLKECPDAPVALYVLGNSDLDIIRPVAIVGTRHSTVYGENFNTKFVQELAERVSDIAIISGLAYGTDICAHRAALNSNTRTIAVLANPLDTIYPAIHREDAVRIIRQGGALVSETPTSATINRASFLSRNRIIAGLSKATIVMESDLKGGSMTTARLANAYNRDVFALPGRITDKYSRGCNQLIARQGAFLLDSVESFAAEMRWPLRKKNGEQQDLPLVLDSNESMIIGILEKNPTYNVNEIATEAGVSYPQLMDIVFKMEMKGLIRSLPGNKYAIIN